MVTNRPTVVSMVVVQVDDKIMCEMSDNNVATYTCWAKLDASQLKQLRFKRADEIVEACRNYNAMAQLEANARLDAYKYYTYGDRYQARGY